MLYDEAVKQIDFAIENLEKDKKEFDKISNALIKAQDIITELMASLDFERGGEIAKNLFGLYVFFNQELVKANISKEYEPAKSVRKMLKELRSAWGQILAKGATGDSQDIGGVNIAG